MSYPNRIDRTGLMAEVDRLRSALTEIVDMDGTDQHGVYDEWSEAESFRMAQKIAKNALNPVQVNTVRHLDPEEEDAALEGFRAI